MVFLPQEFARKEGMIGSIEVICGSMFSGKTEELIRRLRRAKFAKMQVEIFKPLTDTRYDSQHVVSHNNSTIPSTIVADSSEILNLKAETRVIGIDEAQFFDHNLAQTCNLLACRGVRVIVAGLDMDFEGKPFGPIPEIMAIAEHVTKLHAVCMQCGSPANYSYRLVPSREKLLIGEKETYEPRCRRCFTQGQGKNH